MYIDLTVKVNNDSPMIEWAKKQNNPHIAMGHIGTHIDVYEKTIIPLEYFHSNAVFFNVKGIYEVGVKDIDIELIKENDFVIFRTGDMEKYGYGEKGYFENHSHLSKELIEILCKKKVRFIGIDSPGIRQSTEHEIYDRICEKNGIYVIENLNNLENINIANFPIYTMWIDDEKMTGLKCRVIADI